MFTYTHTHTLKTKFTQKRIPKKFGESGKASKFACVKRFYYSARSEKLDL